MADKKITSMNTTTAPAASDLMLVVVDPSGTPLNKTVTITNLANTVANQNKTGNTVQSNVDGVDTVFKQYDGTEVARIHDGAVVPTASGTSTSLSAGTGFGYRRRVIALGSGNETGIAYKRGLSVLYAEIVEPICDGIASLSSPDKAAVLSCPIVFAVIFC